MRLSSRISMFSPFSRISFMGKVHVYSDFDGTYCPERHSAMHNLNQNPSMVNYCNKMKDFFQSTKNDLDFHITTGRTFGECVAVAWLMKFRDYRLPLPDSLITKNGSDEFLKNGTDDDFYNNGKFPYDYTKTSKEKENKIKSLTNWDGKKIKNFVKAAAQKACLGFVEGDTENSVNDYGEMSLFSTGKLNSHDWKKLPQHGFEIAQHESPVAEYVIGSRNDGNLKINLIFPPDYGYCPFRNWVYDNYVNEIRQNLNSDNVKYAENWETPNHKNHYRTSLSIAPKINGKELTKIFDTKEAVQKALKNKDLVIVAGDGSNDFTMLNPLEYITEDEWVKYAEGSKNPEFFNGDMRKKLRDLRHIYKGNASEYIDDLREELTQNGFLKHIEQMPFVGIVIKKDNSKLQKLVDTFSPIGKIIVVEKGELDKGIIKATKNYAEINPDFKNDMSEDFKNYVYLK